MIVQTLTTIWLLILCSNEIRVEGFVLDRPGNSWDLWGLITGISIRFVVVFIGLYYGEFYD